MYFLVGGDGKDYGPVDLETLKSWLADQRASTQSIVKNATTGESMSLGALLGVQPANVPTAPPQVAPHTPPAFENTSNYPRFETQAAKTIIPWAAFLWPLLALTLFLFTSRIGFFIALFSLYDGFRAWRTVPKLGLIAFIWSIAVFIFIAIGYFARPQGTG